MLEHLRRAGSAVAVVLVGLSFLVLDPSAPRALALACPPLSSLCNPAGLAVYAASEAEAAAVVVGTAEAVAGSAAAAATLQGASISVGAYGAAVGTAAAGSAVVGLGVWAADEFRTGSSVGWAGAGLPPGWNMAPVVSVPILTHTGSTARVSAVVVSSPAYGVNGATQVRFTWAETPFTDMRGVVAVHVVQRDKTTGVVGWSGGEYFIGQAPLLVTVADWGVRYAFDHIEIAGGQAAGSFTGAPKWFPEGHSSRPVETPAGMGVMTRTIECTGADGVPRNSEASWTGTLTSAAPFAMPEVKCPAGKVITHFGQTWVPAGGGVPVEVVPWTATGSWVGTVPTEYPNCLTAECRLDLRKKVEGAPSTSCGYNAVACPDWYRDPARSEQYECYWGPYVVSLLTCSTFRDPGYARPNVKTTTELDPSGQPYQRPTTEIVEDWPDPKDDPAPGADPVPEPGGTSETSACYPTGWGALNPVEWVYRPVKCALSWAFVPPPGVVEAEVAETVDLVRAKPPFTLFATIAPVFQGFASGFGPGGSCTGVLADFDPLGDDLVLPCSPPTSPPLTVLRAVCTFSLVLATGFYSWHMLVAAMNGKNAEGSA